MVGSCFPKIVVILVVVSFFVGYVVDMHLLFVFLLVGAIVAVYVVCQMLFVFVP